MTIVDAPPLAPAAKRHVLLPFGVVTLLWGSTWLVIRDQIGTVPVSWSVCYRFLVAAAAMAAYGAATGQSLRIGRRELGVIGAIGLTLFCGNFQFVYRAEAHVTSGVVATVFALLMVPNAILARIFLGQGLSRPFLLGSLVAVVGIGFLSMHEIGTAPRDAGEIALGIFLTLVGVLCASAGNILQATAPVRALPMPTLLAWAMLAGALCNALIALVTTGAPVIDLRPSYALGVLYLGLFASALAFPLYFGVIREIGAARAAYSSVIVPVIAMTLSTIFEGYRWSATSVVGALLVLIGLIFALRSRKPAR